MLIFIRSYSGHNGRKELDMKRLLIMGLIALCSLAFLDKVFSAEIYWDRNAPVDDTITPQDFGENQDSQADETPTRFNMYDDFNVPDSDSPRPAGRADQPVVPEPEELTRPQAIVPVPVTPASRNPDTLPRTSVDSPRPATTVPGALDVQRGPQRTPTADSQNVQGRGESTGDKPVTKRMQWGQVDVKPSEERPQFKWGEGQTDRRQ
jgi:hypothetical protein